MSEKDDADAAARLRRALIDLVAEQNGPPLIRSADRWLEAMAGAHEAPGEHEAAACYRAQLQGR